MEAKVLYDVPPEILVFVDEVLEEGVLSEWKLRHLGEPLETSGYISGLISISHSYKIETEDDLEKIMCVMQTCLLYGEEKNGGLELYVKKWVRLNPEIFSLDKYGQILRFEESLKVAKKWGGRLYPSPLHQTMETRFGVSVKLKG